MDPTGFYSIVLDSIDIFDCHWMIIRIYLILLDSIGFLLG